MAVSCPTAIGSNRFLQGMLIVIVCPAAIGQRNGHSCHSLTSAGVLVLNINPTVFVIPYRRGFGSSENLRTALLGIHAGLVSFSRLPSCYRGLTVYAEWTTTPDDWRTWRGHFLRREVR